MESPTFDPSSLPLREQHLFLVRLARSLVRDEATADDVVQDVWLSILRRRDREVGRGWLARAVRHRVQNLYRGGRHRLERERAATRPESVEDDVHERLEIQAGVLDVVRGLPDAVRAVVYLHYCEDASVGAISERLGVPRATVKSRLARGRALLRDEIERSGGPGARRALLALAGEPLTTDAFGVSTKGLLWMGTGTKVVGAIALVSVLAAVAYEWTPRRGALRVPAEDVAAAAPSPVELPDPVSEARRAEVRRPASSAEASAEATSAPPPTAPAASVAVRGIVVDSNAAPLAGVTVVGSDESGERVGDPIRSAADGRFLWTGPRARLAVDEDELVTLFASIDPARTDAVVVAERREALRGTVEDERGAPVAGAELTFVLPEGFRRRFPMELGGSIATSFDVRTDAEGRFRLAGAARVDGAQVSTRRDGFVPRRDAFSALHDGVRIVLRRPGEGDDVLYGLVLDELGLPVSGARVSFGAEVMRTDAEGLFWLPRRSSAGAYGRLRAKLGRDSRLLTALAPGYLPARLEVDLDPVTGDPAWPDGLVLQLAGEALAIEGQVVDPDGLGLDGVSVFLRESTLFSMEGGSSSVENVLGGDPEERITLHPTDENGWFRIEGLAPRSYSIAAFDSATGVQAASAPVRAGETVEIVLDRSRTYRSLRGRVLSPFGDVIAGATVGAFRDVATFFHEGQEARATSWLLARTTSATDGSFVFLDLPSDFVYLRVLGADVIETVVGVETPLADPEAEVVDGIDIVVPRSALLRVRAPGDVSVDGVSVLDAGGAELPLRVHGPKPGAPLPRMPFHGDVTDILVVDERASVLVYWSGEAEALRRPVTLQFGELTDL